MEFVTPARESFILPADTIAVAMHAPPGHPEVQTVDTLITSDGKTVLQLQVTPGELALLNAGARVTVVLYAAPMPPIAVGVGGFDLT
jgi:hypothetical protein